MKLKCWIAAVLMLSCLLFTACAGRQIDPQLEQCQKAMEALSEKNSSYTSTETVFRSAGEESVTIDQRWYHEGDWLCITQQNGVAGNSIVEKDGKQFIQVTEDTGWQPVSNPANLEPFGVGFDWNEGTTLLSSEVTDDGEQRITCQVPVEAAGIAADFQSCTITFCFDAEKELRSVIINEKAAMDDQEGNEQEVDITITVTFQEMSSEEIAEKINDQYAQAAGSAA